MSWFAAFHVHLWEKMNILCTFIGDLCNFSSHKEQNEGGLKPAVYHVFSDMFFSSSCLHVFNDIRERLRHPSWCLLHRHRVLWTWAKAPQDLLCSQRQWQDCESMCQNHSFVGHKPTRWVLGWAQVRSHVNVHCINTAVVLQGLNISKLFHTTMFPKKVGCCGKCE